MNLSRVNQQIPYREFHPFPPFIPLQAVRIIIGSFPPIKLITKYNDLANDPVSRVFNSYLQRNPKRKSDLDFYYGSESNLFWQIFGDIHGRTLKNISEIKLLLEESETGITDIVEIGVRKIYCRKNRCFLFPSEISPDNDTDNYFVGSGDQSLIPIRYRNIMSILDDHQRIRVMVFTSGFAFKHFRRAYPLLDISGKEPEYDLSYRNRDYKLLILPSPSGAANISIGGRDEYKERKRSNPSYNTYQYRIEKYKEALI